MRLRWEQKYTMDAHGNEETYGEKILQVELPKSHKDSTLVWLDIPTVEVYKWQDVPTIEESDE